MLGDENAFIKIVGGMVLIFGLLKFAKEAPDLIKDFFAGDMFKGLNLKPGVKNRIQDNDLLMRGINGVASGIGGAKNRIQANRDRINMNKNGEERSGFGKIMHGAGSALRGFSIGSATGAVKSQNRSIKLDDLLNEEVAGAQRNENVDTSLENLKDGTFMRGIQTQFQNANKRIGLVNDDHMNSNTIDALTTSLDSFNKAFKMISEDTQVKQLETQRDRAIANVNLDDIQLSAEEMDHIGVDIYSETGLEQGDPNYDELFNERVMAARKQQWIQKRNEIKSAYDDLIFEQTAKAMNKPGAKEMAKGAYADIQSTLKKYGAAFDQNEDISNKWADLQSVLKSATASDEDKEAKQREFDEYIKPLCGKLDQNAYLELIKLSEGAEKIKEGQGLTSEEWASLKTARKDATNIVEVSNIIKEQNNLKDSSANDDKKNNNK